MEATWADPFDMDTYFLQRMNEFFGPGFERILPPATARPERIARRGWIEPAAEELLLEAGLEEGEEETEEAELSRRQRRRLRQRIALDIVETDDAFVVEANLPGIPKENIEVHVDHNNVLTINARAAPLIAHTETAKAGVRVEEVGKADEPPQTPAGQTLPTPRESPTKPRAPENRKFLLSERHKGRMHRTIRLPKYADPQEVESCMEMGVLCLSFAKLPEHQVAHRIELK